MIAFCWPVTHNHRAAWLDDVAHGAQCITEIFCIVFLIATAKQRNQLTFEVDLFQAWEEVIPVTLGFTVIPGWNTDQQDIEFFQILFAALRNVMHLSNIFTQLFLDHFCDVFGVTCIGSKEDSYYGHKISNLLFSMKSLTLQAIMPQIIANSSHREHVCAHLVQRSQVYRVLLLSVIAFVCFVGISGRHRNSSLSLGS